MIRQEDWQLDNEVNRLNVDGRMTYFYELFVRPAELGTGHAAGSAVMAGAASLGLDFFARQLGPAWVAPELPPGAGLARMIAESARAWLGRLAMAEIAAGQPQPADPRALAHMTALFGRMVECESLRRLCVRSPHKGPLRTDYARCLAGLWADRLLLDEVVRWRDLPGFSREVVANWNPLWRRYGFVLYSPFDTFRRLDVLADERAAWTDTFATRVAAAAAGLDERAPEADPSPMRDAKARPGRRLIAIEGIDGAGKTTIRYALYEALRAAGEGSFIIGQRGWLDADDTKVIVDFREQRRRHAPQEVCAARFRDKHALAQTSVAPALRTHHVVADRYLVSDGVYEEALLGVPAEAALNRHREAGTPEPDLTVFLDLDPRAAVERIGDRKRNRQVHENLDDLTRISTAYRRIYADPRYSGGERLLRLSRELVGDVDGVTAQVVDLVRRRLAA